MRNKWNTVKELEKTFWVLLNTRNILSYTFKEVQDIYSKCCGKKPQLSFL